MPPSTKEGASEGGEGVGGGGGGGGVGFLGLGIMGRGMASRLLSQGIAGTSPTSPLVVWNRTASKCDELRASFPDHHIVIADSPKHVVERCRVTFSMLSTPEASRAVFYGDDGTLAGVSDGASVVDCATLAEQDMERMSKDVEARGGRFLEAPVSGSKVPAASGALIFMCAGSKSLFDDIFHQDGGEVDNDNGVGIGLKGALGAMGKASHYLGPDVGLATRAKLVVNSIMGTMVASLSEGLVLSQSVGLDANKVLEIIGQGAIASPVYSLKGPKMLAGDHAPNFPLKHAHKDMALAKDMATKAAVEFHVMGTAEALFRGAKDHVDFDWANQDFSAVYEYVRHLKKDGNK